MHLLYIIIMFCIKCGKTATAGNFCKRCFLESEHLFNIRNFRVTRCGVCDSIYEKSKKTTIDEAVKNHIITNHKIKRIKISRKDYGNRLIANIECIGTVKPYAKKEEKTVEIIVETRKCDDCTKLAGSYYEAVLQVRGNNKNEILARIEKSNVLSFIKNVDEGYDVRLIKKQDATKLVNLLKQRGVKRTFKLVGEKGGKKIYRVYYLIR